jgi:hypothetical protein
MPPESTLPHAPGQLLPERIHVIARFGLPAEFIAAVKVCVAPSSTEAICGDIEIDMSLEIVACAAELFAESSTLVATIETAAAVDKFTGAV